jgi:serine/threonine protein kinase
MSQETRCSNCDTPLSAGSPGRLCPKCLLKQGLAANTAGFTADEPEASARWSPPEPEELAARFPELEILELIGRGGMGAVYKARQKNLDRLVALKILPPEIGRDPAFAERFAREAQALARLSHPHIVAIHDFGQRDGLFFFLMEYIDGLNLRQLLDSGTVAPKEALAIVPQICDALQFAHDQGIVHRDIKPENILLDRRGQVKIADFGLAKLMGRAADAEAVTEKVMGTPQYMAPEQVEHPKDVDHRADIYSLGVVFYQMLTGELPLGRFEPPSHKVLIDVRLDEVVLRALEKEPGRRYQQASQVKTEVETIVETSAGRPPTSPSTTANPTTKRSTLRTVAIGCAAALAAVGLLLVFLAVVFYFTRSSAQHDAQKEAQKKVQTAMQYSFQKANESVVMSDLQTMRAQLRLYAAQHNDSWPADLANQMTHYTDLKGNVNARYTDTFRYGPYLLAVPENPYTRHNTITTVNGKETPYEPAADMNQGWWYNSTTGDFRCHVPDKVLAHSGDKVNSIE